MVFNLNISKIIKMYLLKHDYKNSKYFLKYYLSEYFQSFGKQLQFF